MSAKLKVGNVIRIPHVTPGHDSHNPKQFHKILQVIDIPGEIPSYRIAMTGRGQWWPETRVSTC